MESANASLFHNANPNTKFEVNPLYEVDTYQITVPYGDCSVHLLVKRPTDPNATSKGEIERCVLMDGGNDGGSGSKLTVVILESALEKIRRMYQDPDKCISFDSWVITHWDQDHWGGALTMFQKSFDGQNKSKYIKYDHNGPTTVLYCPNWTKDPLLAELGFKTPANYKGDWTTKFKPEALSLLDANAESQGEGIVTLNVAKNENKVFCKAKWGHRRLLGCDFFTGERSLMEPDPGQNQDKSWENSVARHFPSFDVLWETTDYIFGTRPRLFCIGASGFYLGRNVTETDLKKAAGKSEPGNTWANFSSITTVLHFPNLNEQRLSLYWAGDSVGIMEEKLVTPAPTKAGDPVDDSYFLKGYTVSVAKWSHHGSRHSSPPILWDNLRPKKCVVSANQSGQYGHPRPEVINRFWKYACDNKLPEDGTEGELLYSTRYPGWVKTMLLQQESEYMMKQRAPRTKKERAELVAVHEALEDFTTESLEKLSLNRSKQEIQKERKRAQEARLYRDKQLTALWNWTFLSRIHPTGVFGKAYRYNIFRKEFQEGDHSEHDECQVVFIHIRSSPDSRFDGKIDLYVEPPLPEFFADNLQRNFLTKGKVSGVNNNKQNAKLSGGKVRLVDLFPNQTTVDLNENIDFNNIHLTKSYGGIQYQLGQNGGYKLDVKLDVPYPVYGSLNSSLYGDVSHNDRRYTNKIQQLFTRVPNLTNSPPNLKRQFPVYEGKIPIDTDEEGNETIVKKEKKNEDTPDEDTLDEELF